MSGTLWERLTSFENLYDAACEARRRTGTAWRITRCAR
jgi:hypothetical protein